MKKAARGRLGVDESLRRKEGGIRIVFALCNPEMAFGVLVSEIIILSKHLVNGRDVVMARDILPLAIIKALNDQVFH